MPADRDRSYLRRSDRLFRVRLGRGHEPERRRRGRAPRPEPAEGRVRRARARPRRCARMGSSRHSCLRSRLPTPLVAELPEPRGRVLYLAAENARRGPIEGLAADYIPLYATRLLSPEPPDGDVVVLASGSAARAYSGIGGRAPAISIGPETSRVARSVGLEVAARSEDPRPRRPRHGRRRVRGPALTMFETITFLSDFGLEDDFVGVCRGVMRAIARDAEIIDLTHGIRPQAVAQGALDPGPRRALSAARGSPRGRRPGGRERAARGRPAHRRGPCVRRARQRPAHAGRRPIARSRPPAASRIPRYHLEHVSKTFHARDVFAPAAAHLAAGRASTISARRSTREPRPARPRPRGRRRVDAQGDDRRRRPLRQPPAQRLARPRSPRSGSRAGAGSSFASSSRATSRRSARPMPMPRRAS